MKYKSITREFFLFTLYFNANPQNQLCFWGCLAYSADFETFQLKFGHLLIEVNK